MDCRSVGRGGERTPYAPGGRGRMEAGGAKADISKETEAPTPRNLKGEGEHYINMIINKTESTA